MSRWSVIMLSYLGGQDEADAKKGSGTRNYSGEKFVNSVTSFVNQDYKDKELVIVSDGCQLTNKLYKKHFSANKDIKLVIMPKATPPAPPNRYRQAGIVAATGDKICYLDPDDCFFPFHLTVIENLFEKDLDWICFGYRVMAKTEKGPDGSSSIRFLDKLDLNNANPNIGIQLDLKPGLIGGGNFAHKRNLNTSWGGDLSRPGRNGDLRFIMQLVKECPRGGIVKGASSGYLLCQTHLFAHNNNINEEINLCSFDALKKFKPSPQLKLKLY